ncbi:hypothetical protein Sango_2926700 [Sesamum angolense]|uniref:Uncharacterized protein n=1 Tax=Sesamum angolense TaxID=2727404 RepID=A0AAE1VVE0_9LAMI|nr:hypothetical protein Sango_2926700 [Sesamum angolense]
MPEFSKYDGTRDPMNHLMMFCSKMAAHIRNDQLLVFSFQNSLTGPALRWPWSTKLKKRNDLADSFMKEYKSNQDMVPTRSQLESMEMKRNETFSGKPLDHEFSQ